MGDFNDLAEYDNERDHYYDDLEEHERNELARDDEGVEESEDESYVACVSEARKGCRCCGTCWPRPCEACLAGGICDDMPCHCHETPDHEEGEEESDGE